MMFEGKKTGIDLASFVSGLVRALTKGQQALPLARMEQIKKHFDQNDQGIYHPKIKTFQLNEKQQVSVPTYSLAAVNAIGIESALIKCSAKIVEVEQDEIDCDLSDESKRVRYCVTPSKNGSGNFEIDIRFSRKMDSEPEKKLTEFLNGLIEVEDIN